MKKTLFIASFLFSMFTFSQKYDGDYYVLKTSYVNELDSSLNFQEETKFNILINEELIVLQDPRIPSKLLMYLIKEAAVEEGVLYSYYKCVNDHLGDNSTSDLHFYMKDNKLNLMISGTSSSQVFYDLKKN